MTFPIFLPIPLPVEDGSHASLLATRAGLLEKAVLRQADLLQQIAQRIEAALGPAALGPEIARLASAGDVAQATALSESIDQAIAAGDKAAAARQLRDILACSWDHAHAAVSHWKSVPHGTRLNAIRLALLVSAGAEEQQG